MNTQKNPVGWFEIPVKDMDRAKKFYEHIFAIELEEHRMGPQLMAWFPMVENAIGSTGSLVQGEDYEPSDKGVLIYFTAPNIEAITARTKEQGGKVIVEKTDIGEHGYIAHIIDSEGNRIGLHCRK